MTNPTPHGQVPEALRIADEFRECLECDAIPSIIDIEKAEAELRRLHAYCQELEAQVILDCMTHVQNPAEIEHVAGEVVAYLDVGASGYLDLGAALSEDALQQLPKGRHALVIAGTYGIDGYVAAPQPSPTTKPAPQPAPAPLSEMPYEKRKAIQEGEQISASDAWFHARHEMLDTIDRRNVFRAGFDRGWNAALAAQGGKA